jgi:hypothetical protein
MILLLNLLFAASAAVMAVHAIHRFGDLLAHWDRYRHHLRSYPASRRWRGDVWKATR